MEGAFEMTAEMKNELKKIQALENKYGLVLFNMSLTHLFDSGHSNFSEENVAKTIESIMAQGEKDKAAGKISVMTPAFQCEIMRCAQELSRFSIWTLFGYIKKHIVIGK
jgi:hypothetical protein